MKKAITVLALLVGLAVPAAAQQFPLSLPANTLYGRLGFSNGPGQAIPFSVLTSQLSTLAGLAQLPIDIRISPYNAVCNGDASTGVKAAIDAIAATGTRRPAFLPSNCWYFPGNNLSTPDNLEIVGESWETSVIASTDQTDIAKDWKIGAHAVLRNVATRTEFCYRQPPPEHTVKTCPLGHTYNLLDIPAAVGNYGFQAAAWDVPASITLPNGVVQTDNTALTIIQRGTGDGFYGASLGNGGDVIRLDVQGIGDVGMRVQNGQSNPANTHTGIDMLEYGTGTASSTLRLQRLSGSTATLLSMVDVGPTTASTNLINLIFNYQSSGKILNIEQGLTPFSGTALAMNLGQGVGTCSGNFAQFSTNSVVMLTVDCTGITTIRPALGVGDATGTRFININGGNTANAGGYLQILSANASIGVIGNRSAVFGGAYSSDFLYLSANSHNWMVSGGSTASMVLSGAGGLSVGTLTDPGIGRISANVGFNAAGSAGLSTTKTVRASGGAADCTLIYVGGILTGGSC